MLVKNNNVLPQFSYDSCISKMKNSELITILSLRLEISQVGCSVSPCSNYGASMRALGKRKTRSPQQLMIKGNEKSLQKGTPEMRRE